MDYSEPISSEKWTKWKRKRKLTMIGFVIVGTIVGIDYSVVLTTLYLYLQDVIETPHAKVYYGVIIGVFGLSSTIAGLISGRLVDKTRKIRLYLNVVVVFQIIGSFMYSIPYSVIFPLLGRALVGIGDPFVNVCSGEVVRIYNNEEGTRALWWLACTYSVGFIVGPAVSLVFKGIHFNIGSLEITYLNFVGIFMGFLIVLTLIITNFMIYDCSAEIDLKEYMKHHSWNPDKTEKSEEQNEETLLITVDNGDHAMMTWQHVVSKLLRNRDMLLLFVSTFFFMYCLFSTDVLLPLLCVVTLEWDITSMTYIFVVYGVGFTIILIIMSRFCTSSKRVYYGTLWCIVCQAMQFIFLLAIAKSQRENTQDIMLVGLYLINWLFVWCIEEVLLRSMVARMVPSQVQSFTESIRAGVARISTILAALTTPLLMTFLATWAIILIAITFAFLICFILLRKSLKQPNEITF